MAITWVRLTPGVVNDGDTLEWTSTGAAHYTEVDEGVTGPANDSDYILSITGDKEDRLRIPKMSTNGAPAVTSTDAVHRVRFGFRYKAEAVPVSPALSITILVDDGTGTVQPWGSTTEVSLNTDGEWHNGQVTFNVGPGRTVADWDVSGVRAVGLVSAPATGGGVPPEDYQFQTN
jgi:hypothetical protein